MEDERRKEIILSDVFISHQDRIHSIPGFGLTEVDAILYLCIPEVLKLKHASKSPGGLITT
jgi:hypothetical protein